jgi:hypothetical protein
MKLVEIVPDAVYVIIRVVSATAFMVTMERNVNFKLF